MRSCWSVRWGVVVLPIVASVIGAGLSATVGAQGPSEHLEISEVRASAGRGAQEAAFEWVEIHNPTEAVIDLAGWSLADNRGEDPLPAVALGPGERLVVGGSEALVAELPEGLRFVAVDDGRIGNGLANSGDRVVLIDPGGTAVDGVSWGSDRTIENLPVPADGRTLSRGEDGAWVVAEASPGGAGRVAPAAAEAAPGLRIVEIFANAGKGSREAAFEWVELLNPTAMAVELEGWQISDNAATDVLPRGRVEAGGLVVIAATAEAVAGSAVSGTGPNVLIVGDGRLGNGLANDGDVVSLRDPAGRLVDEVDYRSPPLPRPEAGRSIALSDGGWVLNTAPSPGSDSVTPLLAGLQAPAEERPVTEWPVEGEDGGGLPAWGLVAIALGAPLGAVAGREVWRRRSGVRAVLRPALRAVLRPATRAVLRALLRPLLRVGRRR